MLGVELTWNADMESQLQQASAAYHEALHQFSSDGPDQVHLDAAEAEYLDYQSSFERALERGRFGGLLTRWLGILLTAFGVVSYLIWRPGD